MGVELAYKIAARHAERLIQEMGITRLPIDVPMVRGGS